MSTATINWVLPTARTDGSALLPADIISVDVFDMSSATPTVAIGKVLVGTSFTTGVLTVGDHGFTMVVNDSGGRKSVPSPVVVGTVAAPPVANPNPVTGVTVTINP